MSSGNSPVVKQHPDTLRGLVEWAAECFESGNLYYGHGTDNARDEAIYLVLRGLGLPFDVEEAVLDQKLGQKQLDHLLALIKQRVQTRKPAAYLLGEAWFAGMRFQVNENVLVPRSPFAELIAERFSPWCEFERIQRILDIGTGSGCIAIACAQAFPHARVDAIDICEKALAVARQNVDFYALHEQVTLIQSDLFQGIENNKYDLIITNPPYVDDMDMATLPAEYKHEPVIGLYAGKDGLDIVKRILNTAAHYLTDDGVIFVEVGNSQQALMELYPEVPFLWLEFEHGGEGIFLLTREELQRWFA